MHTSTNHKNDSTRREDQGQAGPGERLARQLGLPSVRLGLARIRERATHVSRAITIDAPAEALRAFCRDLRTLPQVMEHVSIEQLSGDRSRWTSNGSVSAPARWEVEIVDEQPGELIAWSTSGAPVENRGTVRFQKAPGGRGTEVVVDMHYDVRGGVVGELFALSIGRDPGLAIEQALRKLKQIFEIGELMRSDASIHSGLHAARPPSAGERSSVLHQAAASAANGGA